MDNGQGEELPSGPKSMSGLRHLPVCEAVKALMENGEERETSVCRGGVRRVHCLLLTPAVGVLPFARVCSLLGAYSVAAEHEVLEGLQHACVLVQGCWVVRSEVLYPKNYTSPHNGIGSDVMCRARDLIVSDCMGGVCHCMGV